MKNKMRSICFIFLSLSFQWGLAGEIPGKCVAPVVLVEMGYEGSTTGLYIHRRGRVGYVLVDPTRVSTRKYSGVFLTGEKHMGLVFNSGTSREVKKIGRVFDHESRYGRNMGDKMEEITLIEFDASGVPQPYTRPPMGDLENENISTVYAVGFPYKRLQNVEYPRPNAIIAPLTRNPFNQWVFDDTLQGIKGFEGAPVYMKNGVLLGLIWNVRSDRSVKIQQVGKDGLWLLPSIERFSAELIKKQRDNFTYLVTLKLNDPFGQFTKIEAYEHEGYRTGQAVGKVPQDNQFPPRPAPGSPPRKRFRLKEKAHGWYEAYITNKYDQKPGLSHGRVKVYCMDSKKKLRASETCILATFIKTKREKKTETPSKQALFKTRRSFETQLVEQSELEPVTVPDGLATITIGSEIRRIYPGRGGRILVCETHAPDKLQLFDVVQMKIITSIEVDNLTECSVAAGGRELYVLDSKEQKIRVWSLYSGNMVRSLKVPADEPVYSIGMGSRVVSPLLAVVKRAHVGTAQGKMCADFLDSKTLELLVPDTRFSGITVNRTATKPCQIMGTPDGSLYVSEYGMGQALYSQLLPVIQAYTEDAELYEYVTSIASPKHNMHAPVPGPAGRSILTEQFITDARYGPIQSIKGRAAAALDGNYYVIYTPGAPGNESEITVYSAADFQPLATIPINADMLPGKNWRPKKHPALPFAHHINYSYQAGILVLVPATGDRLNIVPLRLDDLLREQTGGYLYVDSVCPRFATPGYEYRYPIKVQTNMENVAFELTKGPEGMAVSLDGVITWHVSDFHKDYTVEAEVTIDADNGKTVKYPFTFNVIKPYKPDGY